MTQLHLVGVLVRVLAVLLVVTGLFNLSYVFLYDEELSDIEWTLALLVTIVLPLIAGLALWSMNLLVARRFFFRQAGERPLSLDGVEHLETALYGLLGLWLIVSALVSLARSAAWLLLTVGKAEGVEAQFMWAHSFGPDMVATLTSLLLGIALLLGRNGLLRALQRIRGRH